MAGNRTRVVRAAGEHSTAELSTHRWWEAVYFRNTIHHSSAAACVESALPSQFILAVGHVRAGRLIVWVGSLQPHHHVKQIKHSNVVVSPDIGGAVLRRSTTAIFVISEIANEGLTLHTGCDTKMSTGSSE